MASAIQNLFAIFGLSPECPPTMQTFLPWFIGVIVAIAVVAKILDMFESLSMYFTSGGRRMR